VLAQGSFTWLKSHIAVDITIPVVPAEYGNTSAASIPLALNQAVRSGSIKKGDVVSE
jgi:3-oxoacyl-[acyl-carrier-protein] synthase III